MRRRRRLPFSGVFWLAGDCEAVLVALATVRSIPPTHTGAMGNQDAWILGMVFAAAVKAVATVHRPPPIRAKPAAFGAVLVPPRRACPGSASVVAVSGSAGPPSSSPSLLLASPVVPASALLATMAASAAALESVSICLRRWAMRAISGSSASFSLAWLAFSWASRR